MAQIKKIKEIFDISIPHMNIATIGHVDHGKTTLVSAILTILADLGLAVERDYDSIDSVQGSWSKGEADKNAGGITISTTQFEFFWIENGQKKHFSLVDCPGHASYIKNMITGTAQVDGAILLVSAREGISEQTREHLLLAARIGIKNLVVYINKVDQVGEDEFQLLAVEEEIRDFLKSIEYDVDKVDFIRGSALWASEKKDSEIGKGSILKLMKAISNFPIPTRNKDGDFLMIIGDSKSITGIGTVATGNVLQGTLKPKEDILIVGFGKESIKLEAKSIESERKILLEAIPGLSIGIRLGDIGRDKIRAGQVVVKPNKFGKIESVKICEKFEVEGYFLPKRKSKKAIKEDEEGISSKDIITDGFSPQFSFWTAYVTGIIELPEEKKYIKPGVMETFTVKLISGPMAIKENLGVVIMESNKIIGWGTITKPIE